MPVRPSNKCGKWQFIIFFGQLNNYLNVPKLSEFRKHHSSFYKGCTYFKEILQQQQILLQQIFFERIFSKFQFHFRKCYSAQHCFLMMLETWKEATDENKAFGALLTN